MLRRFAPFLVLLALLAAVSPSSAHQSNDHPDVEVVIDSGQLLGGGHVEMTGRATCPPGEDWGVGFHVYEDPDNPSRQTGMAALSVPVHPVPCDGTWYTWTARSEGIHGGGVVTPGVKPWGAKMQSPSSGEWVHKDVGHRGTAPVSSSAGDCG